MLYFLKSFWLKRTTHEYWVVLQGESLKWCAFKSRDEALQSAIKHHTGLYKYIWSEMYDWVSQCDMDSHEIWEKYGKK